MHQLWTESQRIQGIESCVFVKRENSKLWAHRAGFNHSERTEKYQTKQKILWNLGSTNKTNSPAPELPRKRLKNWRLTNARITTYWNWKTWGVGSPFPFVSAPEVDLYVAREDLTTKKKDTRLYLEVQYACDSCLSLQNRATSFGLSVHTKTWAWMSTAATWKYILRRLKQMHLLQGWISSQHWKS